jgi:hypothetical protein
MPSLQLAIVLKKHLEKKEQGAKPCSKIVSTLNFPENLDLILIIEATLLVRVRAPPETWTTKLCLSASLSLNW